jgi:hypothetical protein
MYSFNKSNNPHHQILQFTVSRSYQKLHHGLLFTACCHGSGLDAWCFVVIIIRHGLCDEPSSSIISSSFQVCSLQSESSYPDSCSKRWSALFHYICCWQRISSFHIVNSSSSAPVSGRIVVGISATDCSFTKYHTASASASRIEL